MNSVWLVNLAVVAYADALALQHRLVEARKRGAGNDTLLLLEHPPVFTLGRNANEANVIASRESLARVGIDVFRVERGGDVTYHGPGQLVGYPILDLQRFRLDVGWYVRALEEVLLRALADFGIAARLIEKLIGVWVDAPLEPARGQAAKLAQIGARIEQGITYHGFALNVDPNLAHFDLIVPCGIRDKGVTAMAQVLRQPVAMHRVRERIAAHFAEVFAVELIEITYADLLAHLETTRAPE